VFAEDINSAPEYEPRRPARSVAAPLLIAFGMALLGLFVAVVIGVGKWLVVEDPLEKAEAIVVLSGRLPIRAVEAARLYRAGYAPEIWLTHPEQPTASLAAIDIPYSGEDFYNARVLEHYGVPSTAIRVLDPPINNTADEVRVIADELARQHAATIIVVTTKAHTRRVHHLWQRYSGRQGRAVVRAAQDDPYDPAHWWRSTGDALDVVREVLGLLNAWTGLPLRPSHS
jgi:uncharacterized SAM-binding protein YcdF (DUF218 family)